MRKIVISEFMDEAAIHDGLSEFSVVYDPKLVDEPARLARELADAVALVVRNRTQVRRDLLDAAPRLRVVGRLGVGLDNIDVDECKRRGVAVFPATGANDDSVAEYVVACALTLLRGAFHATADVASGAWPRTRLMGREIGGKRLGLVGFGSIARQTARRAAALGMSVAAFDPFLPPQDPAWAAGGVEPQALDALLASSDVVSLHVPLTADTRGMIDAAAIARMKRGAILVNAARGGVVVEEAVVEALNAGWLGGAALDVFEHEPMTAEAGKLFGGVPNLILTPHIAGVTVEANTRVSYVTVDAVKRFLQET